MTRGLVVAGDSISVGAGDGMFGVPMRSWAHWLALALDLPYTCLAIGGVTTAQALRDQAPRLRGPYDIGCVYVGLNDMLPAAFAISDYERDLRALAEAVAGSSAHLLLATYPRDAGRPLVAAAQVSRANDVVRALAGEHGATLVECEDLCGWLRVLPDRIHLTALGQLEIAERAARALLAAGFEPRAMPSELTDPPRSARAQLARYALTTHLPLMALEGRRRRYIRRALADG